MNVYQLIEELKKHPENMEVKVYDNEYDIFDSEFTVKQIEDNCHNWVVVISAVIP